MKKILAATTIGFIIALAPACSPGSEQTEEEKGIRGKQLASIHCASCHQFPEPDLLDQETWDEYILPRMGYMMGVLPEDSIGPNFIEPPAREIAFANPLLFRQHSALKAKEWQSIRDYYTSNAPKTLQPPSYDSVQNALPIFRVRKPQLQLSPPSTTMVRFGDDQRTIIGDAHTKALYLLNENMVPINAAKVREGAVWLIDSPQTYTLLSMGSFAPTDQPSGIVLELPKLPDQPTRVLIDNLRRPVHMEKGDLNADGLPDLVICEFAKWTGRLAWWEALPNGSFRMHPLRDLPGAIKAYIRDLNRDGHPDIIALFGQGDEGIFIYYNRGDGQFEEEKVISFPPSYGSSYFDLQDFNRDGYVDILYTAGDNADYPPIVKPYHGIRIFLNDGSNQFDESFFYPMPGAYGARAEDFDQDGDLDLAAIAFFPDFQRTPLHSFVYLQNNGEQSYQSFSFPEVNQGRWLVMESGDWNGDGDIDLILGSLAFEVVPKLGLVDEWVRHALPFVILENTAAKD